MGGIGGLDGKPVDGRVVERRDRSGEVDGGPWRATAERCVGLVERDHDRDVRQRQTKGSGRETTGLSRFAVVGVER